MEDEEIVDLYWQRNEAAIAETENKYNRYLTKIAYHILADLEDSRDCVNETYFHAWNAMPPNRPKRLSLYLAKITRRLSIDLFRKNHRGKRIASEYIVSLSELEEAAAGTNPIEEETELRRLSVSINTYLRTLSADARNVFIGRYYFMDSIKEIASYCDMSESKAKSMLFRIRSGLKVYLEQEGFDV